MEEIEILDDCICDLEPVQMFQCQKCGRVFKKNKKALEEIDLDENDYAI